MAQEETLDVQLTDGGSIILFDPLTDTAKEWVKEYIPADGPRMGGSIAVERRYAFNIVQGMQKYGLTVA